MSLMEILAAGLSALGVWLTARRKLLCWPVSLLAALLYGVVFFDARLYADMALQAVFAAFLLYGWWHWARNGRRADEAVSIVTPSRLHLSAAVLAGLLGGLAWGCVLATWTDDPVPFMDAALSSASIVAQFWMARRYRLCWAAWIVIDGLYVGLFCTRGLYLTALLYGLFVGLAWDGWRRWRSGLWH